MNLSYYPRQRCSCSGDFLMPSAVSTASVRGAWRRLRRNRRGSAAVEFALVAPIFFALLFAIIETGIIFFASQVLETVNQNSARTIMTGQTQNAALTQAQFATFVCTQVPALFTCGNIYIDVQKFNSFANIPLNDVPIDGAGNFVNNMQYNTGGPCDIVRVRMFYQWPQVVTGLGYNITNLTGNKRLLAATAAFRNEPYNGSCS
jgi:Flp pilus assembly protein TadG